jgi:hypothetical protein
MKTTDPFNRKNNQPFETPKGYFETFPTKLQESILEEEANKTWWERIKPILEGRFTITTAIATFLVIVVFGLTKTLENSKISEDDAYAYLSELEPDELSEYLIIDYMNEIPSEVAEPSEEEIMEYLLEQEYIESEIY